MACQDPGGHRGPQEKRAETALEVTQVTLDQEESLEHPDQRETVEDLVLAILDQEDHRVKEESLAILELAAAEVTVVRRGSLELKEPLESQVNLGRRVNLDLEDQEEILGVMEILVLREILASLNAMS